MRKKLLLGLCVVVGIACGLAKAAEHSMLTNPAPGVVCDVHFCANTRGVSERLTTQYLGVKKGQQLVAQGEFDRTAFSFANGVYCDTKEKVCRKDRYFGADGKPSGAIDKPTTQLLFVP